MSLFRVYVYVFIDSVVCLLSYVNICTCHVYFIDNLIYIRQWQRLNKVESVEMKRCVWMRAYACVCVRRRSPACICMYVWSGDCHLRAYACVSVCVSGDGGLRAYACVCVCVVRRRWQRLRRARVTPTRVWLSCPRQQRVWGSTWWEARSRTLPSTYHASFPAASPTDTATWSVEISWCLSTAWCVDRSHVELCAGQQQGDMCSPWTGWTHQKR